MSARVDTPLTRHAGIDVPVICGPMYPCSNPELVAAVSEAGGIGIVQPISLTYVHGYDFREGLRYIRSLTTRPIGFNALIEASSKTYRERMDRWIDIALEEGVRFFVTSLGKPHDVVRRVHAVGGRVYHDVTSRRWAEKGLDGGVDGLIAVNRLAGGHAGPTEPADLFEELADLGVPIVRAGGVSTQEGMREALRSGYVGVQCGTRFIATIECTAADDYKQALIDAEADDIVLTERLTGVPVAVIETPWVRAIGTRAGPLARWMLRGRRRKHLMRVIYALRSLRQLKRDAGASGSSRGYWQAGRSVAGIDRIESAASIVRSLGDAARDVLRSPDHTNAIPSPGDTK